MRGVLVVRGRDKSRKRITKGKATCYNNIIVFRISFLFHFHLQFQYKCEYLKFQIVFLRVCERDSYIGAGISS